MKTFTAEELKEILAAHRRWLYGEEDGTRAELRWAKLTGADLTGANLRRADLSWTDLTGANLTGAKLRDANLTGANLPDADLTDADLTDANLTRADLTRANLTDADLRGADLRGANLTGANLTDADLRVTVPVIPNIDSTILDAISEAGCSLDMGMWHTCETTHCRAGWAVHLAGPAGKILEQVWGPNVAGALIYNASRPGQRVPNFTASNKEAMEDMVECAAKETPPSLSLRSLKC